jgi:hypothetical protein
MSNRTPVKIASASDEQLKEFAANVLQLDLDEMKATTRVKIIGAIGTSWIQDFILVAPEAEVLESQEGQDDAPRPFVQDRLIGTGCDLAPKALIRIAQTAMPGGKHPVPVSVNGRQKVIQRNMNVEVPWPYVEALLNAVVGDSQQDETTREIIVTEVTNYPVTILRHPDPVELKDWLESTKDIVMA